MAKPIQIKEERLAFSRAKLVIDGGLELGQEVLVAGRAQCVQVKRKENDNQDGSRDVIYTYVIRFMPETFQIEE